MAALFARSPVLAATVPLLLALASGHLHGATLQQSDVVPSASNGPSSDRATMPSYRTTHRELRELIADYDSVAPVSELRLEREGGVFRLERGVLVLSSPVNGSPAGIVFRGRGSFHLRPPTRIEREQLARFYGSDSLSVEFGSALFLATDGTLSRLREQLEFRSATPAGENGPIEGAMRYLAGEDSEELDEGLLQAYLDPSHPGLFHAHLMPRNGDPLFFRVDAARREEVSFGRAADASTSYYEVISRFHAPEEYEEGLRPDEQPREPIGIDHYAVEAFIDDGPRFAARAELSIDARPPEPVWVPFRLSSHLSVDSARWSSGRRADFARHENGRQLWIRVPGSTDPRVSDRLLVWYRGEDLIDHRRGWYYLQSTSGWYPSYGSGSSTFDLVFHTSDRYRLASVGEKVDAEERDGVITSRWTTPSPVRYATFEVGRFHEFDITVPGIPPVEVLYRDRETIYDREARRRAERAGFVVLPEAEYHKQVGSDLGSTIGFFARWFGEPPARNLRAVEIPYDHGLAAQGIVHLSWLTFARGGDREANRRFRAHEVAHQWWGLGVTPRTYRDRWLSEGFAEFTGLMFTDVVLGNGEDYYERLDAYRNEILDRAGEAGPISLGTRLYTSETEDDYRIITYQKGTWVLHMLRSLFLDLNTLGDDPFLAMLRDLYETYRGERLSTAEFRQHVERHAGVDLGWFFEQWVHGTAIPSYRATYRGGWLENGEYSVALRVVQEGVPDDFRTYVPVFLRLDDGAEARMRVLVEGPVTEVRLPGMPSKVVGVTFNPFDAVLAAGTSVEGRLED